MLEQLTSYVSICNLCARVLPHHGRGLLTPVLPFFPKSHALCRTMTNHEVPFPEADIIRRSHGGESRRRRRMPAEWSRHNACIILYPHWATTFRLDMAQRQVEHVARTIASVGKERVIVYCNTPSDRDKLQQRLAQWENGDQNIQLELCPSNDTWARDTAPTFVYEQTSTTKSECFQDPDEQVEQKQEWTSLAGLDWEFNAYGGPDEGMYWPCDLDRQVASVMCRQLSIPCRSVPIVLEGGSVHTDGEGTILTTEECLLNPNRNPTLTKEYIEERVLSELGASKMIWLPLGLAFDHDTNGHVDNWACFARPGHVILAWTDDEQGDAVNFERCRQAKKLLEQTKDAQGRHLTVHKLHLPSPIYYTRGDVDALLPTKVKQDDGSMKNVPPRKAGERMAGRYDIELV